MKTPAAWLEDHQQRAEAIGVNEFIDYVDSGNGGIWLLSIADGLRSLQAVCLAAHCPVLLVDDSQGRDQPSL